MSNRWLVLFLALASCGATPKKPMRAVAAAPSVDDAPLPLWPEVRRGQLPNGLTYYVMKHTTPAARASLRLVVNAGSLEEDDDQRGLAHFDEHMAFNGTKSFPKSALVEYLEKIGVRFGADLNAHTSYDETIYELEVPTDKTELLGKGLDVMREFAGNVAYDAGEVEKERGVVREEWRTHRGVNQRMHEQQMKVQFQGTRYVDREPIGLPEIIEHGSRDALVRFYKDWYRPDLMAVIAVGDFDVAAVENDIKARFGSLEAPKKPRPRAVGGMPAPGMRIAVEADPELSITAVRISSVIKRQREASRNDLRRHLAEMLYGAILNERIGKIARKPDAPFIAASVMFQSATRELESFERVAIAKQGRAEEALRGLLAEIERFERHGITPAELERNKAELLRSTEELAETQATESSSNMVSELVRNYLEGELVVGGPAERALVREILPTITLAEIAKQADRFSGPDNNRVVIVAGPERDKLPSEAKIATILDEVRKSDIRPWDDGASAVALMEKPPTPGKIVTEKKLEDGVVEWTLSNGIRVVVKPTDFSIDSVSVSGEAPGGLATVSDADFRNAAVSRELADAGGVGNLDAEALKRALVGKRFSVSAVLGETTNSVISMGSVKDLEPMLQLLFLRMTTVRKDEAAFTTWKQNTLEGIANQLREPERHFGIEARAFVWNNNLRHRAMTADEVNKIDLDKSLALFHQQFGDASGYTFVVVGAVELDALKPLVETYLGGLPTTGRKEKERDLHIRPIGGVAQKTWTLGHEPKAHVILQIHSEEPWTREKSQDLSILDDILSTELRETLREDMGGVYGVNVSHEARRSPFGEMGMTISFTCDPQRVAELEKALYARLDALVKDGPKPDELERVRSTWMRKEEVSKRTNIAWGIRLSSAYHYGDPLSILFDTTRLDRMKPELVKAAAKRYLDYKKHRIQLELVPEAAK